MFVPQSLTQWVNMHKHRDGHSVSDIRMVFKPLKKQRKTRETVDLDLKGGGRFKPSLVFVSSLPGPADPHI